MLVFNVQDDTYHSQTHTKTLGLVAILRNFVDFTAAAYITSSRFPT